MPRVISRPEWVYANTHWYTFIDCKMLIMSATHHGGVIQDISSQTVSPQISDHFNTIFQWRTTPNGTDQNVTNTRTLKQVQTISYVNFSSQQQIISAWSRSKQRIKLLKQKILLDTFQLSRNEQETSHKLYMRQRHLAGYLILVSKMLLCLAAFCAQAALWN